MKIDKFVGAIAGAILLAFFFPEIGNKDSAIPFDTIGSVGISLIFFFYGLKLNPEKIKSGLYNWKLHLIVQCTTFLIFPLVALLFYPFVDSDHLRLLWLGLFFLAALPSTVSSSVVMVSMAKGNIPAAIFNASLSGIIGILITPLWMGLFIQSANASFDVSEIYFKLIVEIIVPIVIGILLHRYGLHLTLKYSSQLATFDKSVILLIIFKSFCESFSEKIFLSVSIVELIVLFGVVIGLFFLIYGITGFLSQAFKLNLEDRIAAQFCGTKKSLVHGTVFSKILFGSSPSIGIILLPLMLFHAIQILLVSVIAQRLGDRPTI